MRWQPLLFALALALFGVASAAAAWSFIWPDTSPWVQVGVVEDFPSGSVTPFGDNAELPAFHVVRLGDGALLAVRARGVIHRPGCGVSYRPDIVLHDRAGWFRDSCYPFLYDLAGLMATANTDPPRSLDRLTVEVRDGVVYVNPREIMPGIAGTPAGYEFQAGATLLPLRPFVPAQ